MPTEAEIKTIVDLWNQNRSYGEIAKEVGGPRSTVQGWISKLIKDGVIQARTGLVCTNTKKASAARREYCAEKRIALIDAGMKKLEEMLPSIDKPNGMRDWFVALGTAIDKRRLEDPPKPAENESDGFMEALDAKAEEIWKDHAEADPVQVDPLQPEAMADSHLVEQSKSCPIT